MTAAKVDTGIVDFSYMVPFMFAKDAPAVILKRGLLEKIEVRQNDAKLSAIKLTFNNGQVEQKSPVFGKRLLMDKTIEFTSSIRKVVFTFNTCVT